MKKHEAERVIGAISKAVLSLVEDGGDKAPVVGIAKGVDGKRQVVREHPYPVENVTEGAEIRVPGIGGGAGARLTPEVMEALYRAFRNRMIDELRVDPVFVKLLASQPEIELALEPRVIDLEGSTLKGRIARLIAGGFMDEARRPGTVKAELMRTGTEPNGGHLSTALSDFVKDGILTREGEGFRKAPGLKISERRIET